MRLYFIFVASIDSVINFRVRLEDVYCGNNEVIFSQVYQETSVKREVSAVNSGDSSMKKLGGPLRGQGKKLGGRHKCLSCMVIFRWK